MCDKKTYVIKKIREEKRIADFLGTCDKDFMPILSQRIDIGSYAKKLSQYAQVYCLVSEKQIFGMCAIYLNNGIEAFITSFNVTQQFQNQGYGKILMQHVLHEAKQQNYKIIILEVDKNNEKAILFYKKNSFVVEEEHENWLVMKAKLYIEKL